MQIQPRGLEVLLLIAGQTDLVDRLEREVAATESLARSSLPTKLGSARTALAKLWTEMPTSLAADPEQVEPVRNRRAARAAQRRWSQRRDIELERQGG